MILGNNRRHRLLFLALAGMDVAWSLPWVDFFVGRWFNHLPDAVGIAAWLQSPLFLFLFFWAALVGYMTCADWLNRRGFDSPRRELVIIALVLVTTLLGEIILVYGPRSATGGAWLAGMIDAVFNFTRGIQPALVVFVYNLFLWWRVSVATGQELGFHGVGVSFRLGMLLAIFGGATLSLFGGQTASAILYLFLFFAFGLTASALSRMDDKAWLADNSTGSLLPWGRFLQLLASVGLTLIVAAAFTALITPNAFGIYRRALAPVFNLFAPLWQALVALLIWLLIPVGRAMEWLVMYLRGIIGEPVPMENIPTPQPPQDTTLVTDLVSRYDTLRWGLVIAGILLALFLIWIFFVRTSARTRQDEAEEELPPDALVEESAADKRGLRKWFGLLRRYGVGRSLLAAISVQNLYANLTRLASRRGFPRPAATPPDRYLPILERAFPGSEPQLERLTSAYMRVHYGEVPATSEELQALRADYESVRTASATKVQESAKSA